MSKSSNKTVFPCRTRFSSARDPTYQPKPASKTGGRYQAGGELQAVAHRYSNTGFPGVATLPLHPAVVPPSGCENASHGISYLVPYIEKPAMFRRVVSIA